MLDLKLVQLKCSQATFAAAAAKPLNGIFALSNFAFVTAAASLNHAVVTLTSASSCCYSIGCDISG
jgi:hypothetical protein